MAIDLGWARAGRACAWLAAEGFLVGGLILLLLNLGVGTQPGTTGPAQYANSTWQVVLASAFLLVGMLAIIPVGLTLRELLGRGGIGPELVATFFLAGSLLGIASRLLLISSRLSVASIVTTPRIQPQVLSSYLLSYTTIENATNWLLYGCILLTGLALLEASRAAIQRSVLPRAWGWVGLAAAVGCLLVVLLSLASLVITSVPALTMAARLSMTAVGMVLIPVWLMWLGRELGSAAQVAEGLDGSRPRALRLPRLSIGVPGWLLRMVG